MNSRSDATGQKPTSVRARFLERKREYNRKYSARARDRYANEPDFRKRRQKSNRKYRKAHKEAVLVRNAKHRAKTRKLPFDISVSDVVIPDKCPALGIPLSSREARRKTGGHDASPTLDRIIPKLGYVKGNIAVISKRANNIKSNATPEELRMVADWMERTITKGHPCERC